MSEVILEGWAIHEDVVKENSDEVAEEGFQKLVHGSLEGRRCVAQAERHDLVFVVT